MSYPRTVIGNLAAPSQEELERDELIAQRSLTLAAVAQQLLSDDAGAGLIRAAIICWESEHGRAAALELASTALLGVHHELQSGRQQQN